MGTDRHPDASAPPPTPLRGSVLLDFLTESRHQYECHRTATMARDGLRKCFECVGWTQLAYNPMACSCEQGNLYMNSIKEKEVPGKYVTKGFASCVLQPILNHELRLIY